MANVSLKTDFKDGEKLFGQQLNNNFAVIKAALETMNKIVWQDDPDDSVITFRGTTQEVNAREIIDGQLLYDTTTGETYIDYGSQRISTGSGNAIYIGTGVPSNPSTQLWINPEESILPINTEVVNSMEGSETNKAPSVASAKSYINTVVVDSGTNENGSYIKYIDGTMICYGVAQITSPTYSDWYDFCRATSEMTTTLPVEFLNNDYKIVATSFTFGYFSLIIRSKTTTTFNFIACTHNKPTYNPGNGTFDYVAIGRWK